MCSDPDRANLNAVELADIQDTLLRSASQIATARRGVESDFDPELTASVVRVRAAVAAHAFATSRTCADDPRYTFVLSPGENAVGVPLFTPAESRDLVAYEYGIEDKKVFARVSTSYSAEERLQRFKAQLVLAALLEARVRQLEELRSRHAPERVLEKVDERAASREYPIRTVRAVQPLASPVAAASALVGAAARAGERGLGGELAAAALALLLRVRDHGATAKVADLAQALGAALPPGLTLVREHTRLCRSRSGRTSKRSSER